VLHVSERQKLEVLQREEKTSKQKFSELEEQQRDYAEKKTTLDEQSSKYTDRKEEVTSSDPDGQDYCNSVFCSFRCV
jgi:chromosome segregation ATPase